MGWPRPQPKRRTMPLTQTFKDFTQDEHRDDFARVQAQMVRNWVEGLKAQGIDLQAHYAKRHACYERRWREALIHVEPGAAVLDVGGGNLHEGLLGMLRDLRLDYHHLDIYPEVVAGLRSRG